LQREERELKDLPLKRQREKESKAERNERKKGLIG
jgi:hypothetical protein